MGNGQFGVYFVGSEPTETATTGDGGSPDYARVLYKMGRFPYSSDSRTVYPEDGGSPRNTLGLPVTTALTRGRSKSVGGRPIFSSPIERNLLIDNRPPLRACGCINFDKNNNALPTQSADDFHLNYNNTPTKPTHDLNGRRVVDNDDNGNRVVSAGNKYSSKQTKAEYQAFDPIRIPKGAQTEPSPWIKLEQCKFLAISANGSPPITRTTPDPNVSLPPTGNHQPPSPQQWTYISGSPTNNASSPPSTSIGQRPPMSNELNSSSRPHMNKHKRPIDKSSANPDTQVVDPRINGTVGLIRSDPPNPFGMPRLVAAGYPQLPANAGGSENSNSGKGSGRGNRNEPTSQPGTSPKNASNDNTGGGNQPQTPHLGYGKGGKPSAGNANGGSNNSGGNAKVVSNNGGGGGGGKSNGGGGGKGSNNGGGKGSNNGEDGANGGSNNGGGGGGKGSNNGGGGGNAKGGSNNGEDGANGGSNNGGAGGKGSNNGGAGGKGGGGNGEDGANGGSNSGGAGGKGSNNGGAGGNPKGRSNNGGGYVKGGPNNGGGNSKGSSGAGNTNGGTNMGGGNASRVADPGRRVSESGKGNGKRGSDPGGENTKRGSNVGEGRTSNDNNGHPKSNSGAGRPGSPKSSNKSITEISKVSNKPSWTHPWHTNPAMHTSMPILNYIPSDTSLPRSETEVQPNDNPRTTKVLLRRHSSAPNPTGGPTLMARKQSIDKLKKAQNVQNNKSGKKTSQAGPLPELPLLPLTHIPSDAKMKEMLNPSPSRPRSADAGKKKAKDGKYRLVGSDSKPATKLKKASFDGEADDRVIGMLKARLSTRKSFVNQSPSRAEILKSALKDPNGDQKKSASKTSSRPSEKLIRFHGVPPPTPPSSK